MRVRAACACSISAVKARVGQRRSSGSRARCSSAPSIVRQLRLEPRQRLAEQAERFEQPDDIARRCRRADGSRRSPPGCGGRCDRAVRCAARRPTASRADRTGPAGGRTRSCGLRRRTRSTPAGSDHRPRESAPPRCRAVPGSALRETRRSRVGPAGSSFSRSISSVSRCATKSSVFSFATRQRGACDTSQSMRGSEASIATACSEAKSPRVPAPPQGSARGEHPPDAVERPSPPDRIEALAFVGRSGDPEVLCDVAVCGEVHRHRHPLRQSAVALNASTPAVTIDVFHPILRSCEYPSALGREDFELMQSADFRI